MVGPLLLAWWSIIFKWPLFLQLIIKRPALWRAFFMGGRNVIRRVPMLRLAWRVYDVSGSRIPALLP